MLKIVKNNTNINELKSCKYVFCAYSKLYNVEYYSKINFKQLWHYLIASMKKEF